MATIKGRYVATITINFDMDDNTHDLRPYEEIKAAITDGGLDAMIVSVVGAELEGIASVGLRKQYADAWIVDAAKEDSPT